LANASWSGNDVRWLYSDSRTSNEKLSLPYTLVMTNLAAQFKFRRVFVQDLTQSFSPDVLLLRTNGEPGVERRRNVVRMLSASRP
jgi:hypothetical protein